MLSEHRIVSVGHRVVHGGVKLITPVMIDPQVLSQLEELVPFAPLHQPHNVAAIRRMWVDEWATFSKPG
jgi:acetate kinase